ncbi:MAG: Hsp33 family molecular chaperone HslO [Clostridia bacterium]|nr:Hsp33 family molecular chaperone HslO [Clostridia bacterium]
MKNLLRTLIYDEQVSLTLADTTAIVREGMRLHRLSKGSAYVFGKALSAMTFMSACLKNERGEISLSLKGDGDCGEIGVSGNQALRIRGFIVNTDLQGEANAETERNAPGENASITIIRDDGYTRPFVGACALPQKGGLDEGFEEYFRISEQLPTRIATTVIIDENGECSFAGLVALQPLPFADEETLSKVEKADLESLLSTIKTQGVTACAKENFDVEESVWEEKKAVYKCNCSRRYLTRVLVSLGETQMRQIIREDGAVRVHCHYCNTDYEFTSEDADLLFPKE